MKKIKCGNCSKNIENEIFILNYWVCPYCNYHHYINTRDRLQITADDSSFIELEKNINSVDILNFYDLKSYGVRLKEAKLKTSLMEAIMTGEAKIDGNDVALGIMDFGFMGGSMGSVVGEKIRLLSSYSIEKRIPLIIFCTSGGARMQEGIVSLMQMAKTVSSINRVRDNRIPFIAVIANPTSGGVSASFATFLFCRPKSCKTDYKKAATFRFWNFGKELEKWTGGYDC